MPETPDSPTSTTPVWSPYAPLTPEGPLPPALTESIISSAYRAFRPDLRAKQVLATLGIRPGLEQASRALRRALDRPEARTGDDETRESARPPLFLALYILLRDHLASADRVYREIVQPAETERDERTYLDATAFGERVSAAASQFANTTEPVPAGSDAEALVLFALAYGLLQPDEAAAIVAPVAKLGVAFRRFFGIEG